MANSVADLLLMLRGDTTDIDKKLKATQQELGHFAKEAGNLGSSLTELGLKLGEALTFPLVEIAYESLKLSGHLEQNRIAFASLMGSADGAREHLEMLRDFSEKTPFKFDDVVQGAKRLQSLGFSAEESIPALKAAVSVAATFGTGVSGINSVSFALAKMKEEGVVTSRGMRQLTTELIPAYEILAKVLGTDVAGAMKLVKEGVVSASAVLPAFIEELNTKFGDNAAKMAETIPAMFKNLTEQVEKTLETVGASLTPVAKDVMGFAESGVTHLRKLAEAFAELPVPIQEGAIAVTSFAAALPVALIVIGQMAKGLSELAKTYKELLAVEAVSSFIKQAGGLAGALGAIGAGALYAYKAAGDLREMASALEELGAKAKIASEFTTLGKEIADFGKAVAGWVPGLGFFTDNFSALNSMLDKSVVHFKDLSNMLSINPFAMANSWFTQFNRSTDRLIYGVPIATKELSGLSPAADNANPKLRALAAGMFDLDRSAMLVRDPLVELNKALQKLGIKSIAEETKELNDALATVSRSGVLGGRELTAAYADVKLKLLELKEAVGEAPFKALGVDHVTEAHLNTLAEALRQIHEQFLSGERPVADYIAAMDAYQKAVNKASESQLPFVSHLMLLSPAIGNLNAGLAVTLYEMEAMNQESAADFAVGAAAGLKNLANSSALASASTLTLDGALKSIGLKTAKEMAAQMTELTTSLQTFTAAAKVGVPGAANDAIDAMNKIRDLAIDISNPAPFKALKIQSQASLDQMAEKARANFEIIRDSGTSTWRDIQRAQLAAVDAEIAATGQLVGMTYAQYQRLKDAVTNPLKEMHSEWTKLGEVFKSTLNNLGRGLADAIVNFKSLGDVGKNALRGLAAGLIQLGLQEGTKKLWSELAGIDGMIGKIARDLGGVASSASSIATPSFSGLPIPGLGGTDAGVAATGGAGSPLGSAGSAVAGGLAGWVGAAGSIATAISSIIGNFQNAHMETSLNAIEHNTRYSMMYLGERSDGGILGQLFKLNQELAFGYLAKSVVFDLAPNLRKLVDYVARGPIAASGGGGPGGVVINGPVTINVQGSSDPRATAEEIVQVLKRYSPKFQPA